jgi:hypothetical protein
LLRSVDTAGASRVLSPRLPPSAKMPPTAFTNFLSTQGRFFSTQGRKFLDFFAPVGI